MQKVPKWCVQELALVLFRLAELLRRGGNSEWANVVAHFYEEAQAILLREKFDLALLKSLLSNILSCYNDVSSFADLSLWHDQRDTLEALNSEFQEVRTRLLQIIRDIEKQSANYIH